MIENILENSTLQVILLMYIVGSIPFAIIFSKFFSLPDPRTFGSNNPGATNVMRSGNKIAAFLTLLFDFLKSFLPILILKFQNFLLNDLFLFAIALILGHIFSIFIKFKGGKGVATSYGAIFAIDTYMGLFTMLVWIIIFLLSKVSGLSAIVSFLLLPSIAYLLKLGEIVLIYSFVISLLVLFTHRKNIIGYILKKT